MQQWFRTKDNCKIQFLYKNKVYLFYLLSSLVAIFQQDVVKGQQKS